MIADNIFQSTVQRGKGKKVIILKLFNGLYQKAEYLEGEVVPCFTFPDLKLTVD